MPTPTPLPRRSATGGRSRFGNTIEPGPNEIWALRVLFVVLVLVLLVVFGLILASVV